MTFIVYSPLPDFAFIRKIHYITPGVNYSMRELFPAYSHSIRSCLKMIRAKIWFRCAVVHDPVSPIVVQPALIGWEAKQRQIELTIERAFKGDELLRRMKGWITVDPTNVIEVVNEFGRLKVLDDRELVIEMEDSTSFDNLKKKLFSAFGNEVDVELI